MARTGEAESMFDHDRVVTNGIELHVATAGPVDGPPVVLLHGFPEFWQGMAGIGARLADQGFRVMIPDQRGYNLSDKPDGVGAYRLDRLAGDITGLLDAYGIERASVIGHDWGAVVTWYLAAEHPDRLDAAVIANVPHPMVMARYLRTHPSQLRKSWYMFAFQMPFMPERPFSSDAGRARMAKGIAHTANPGSMDADYQAALAEAWSQPGAPTGMINWYRALLRHRPPFTRGGRVRIPTLILWGEKDRFLEASMAGLSAARCDNAELIEYPRATHWVFHDEPEATTEAIVDFLGRTAD